MRAVFVHRWVSTLRTAPSSICCQRRRIWQYVTPRQRRALSLLGLCGLMDPRRVHLASAAERGLLPEKELSRLHWCFGGDSSRHDNAPMLQSAPSGGTISALSVQLPALERLAPYMRRSGAQILDLGFGSGVMIGMMLAVAGEASVVTGVDLEDKMDVARANLLGMGLCGAKCPFTPFPQESFSLLGGDIFDYISTWEVEGKAFDVAYSGCSLDPHTDQLRRFLGRLKPTGAAVFNLGIHGSQGMYLVTDGGRVCELLMIVNFMMCRSSQTPHLYETSIPLQPNKLQAWIKENVVFAEVGGDNARSDEL